MSRHKGLSQLLRCSARVYGHGMPRQAAPGIWQAKHRSSRKHVRRRRRVMFNSRLLSHAPACARFVRQASALPACLRRPLACACKLTKSVAFT